MHGVHEPRFAARFELAPQITHVYGQGVGVGAEVLAPDALQEQLARQGLARAEQKLFEERELGPVNSSGRPARAPVRVTGSAVRSANVS